MIKIVNPCTCKVGLMNHQAYAKIQFNDGKLSIFGVIGPKSNGDCYGSCGQCVDKIRNGNPVGGWTNEMLQKFCDIWDEWHLNDMRPYCNHMKEFGWVKQAQEKIKVTKWTLTEDAQWRARAAEKRAIECLKKGNAFSPSLTETMYAKLPYGVTTYDDELPEFAECYELKEKDCLGHSNVEYKMRGWISHSEHPLGFISRPCPVCGYKYGTSWIKEEIPQDVIDFLCSLPDSKKEPAWV